VLWGRQDRSVHVSLAERLRRVPGARFVIFEDCGHAPMVEQAQAFGSRLLEFLDDVAAQDVTRH